MSRRKANKKPKALKKKTPESPDVSVEQAIAALREEIIEEVKALAKAQIRSVYGLVEKGKELIELESGSWKNTEKGPAKTETPAQVSANDF